MAAKIKKSLFSISVFELSTSIIWLIFYLHGDLGNWHLDWVIFMDFQVTKNVIFSILHDSFTLVVVGLFVFFYEQIYVIKTILSWLLFLIPFIYFCSFWDDLQHSFMIYNFIRLQTCDIYDFVMSHLFWFSGVLCTATPWSLLMQFFSFKFCMPLILYAVDFFFVLWSICVSSSLIHFKNGLKYLTRRTAEVCLFFWWDLFYTAWFREVFSFIYYFSFFFQFLAFSFRNCLSNIHCRFVSSLFKYLHC